MCQQGHLRILPSEETHMGPEGLALSSGLASFYLVTGQGNPSALVSPVVDEDNGKTRPKCRGGSFLVTRE